MKEAEPPKKRQRVAQACELCRKKKTKCDGARPICKNCTQGNHECVYAHVEKPPPSANTQRKSSVKRLESRLWRVEQLLEALAPQDLVERLRKSSPGMSSGRDGFDDDGDDDADSDHDASPRDPINDSGNSRLNLPTGSGLVAQLDIPNGQATTNLAQNPHGELSRPLTPGQPLGSNSRGQSPPLDDNVPDDQATVIKFRLHNVHLTRDTDMTTISMTRTLGHLYANGPVFTLLSNKGLKWVSEKVGDNDVGVRLYDSVMRLCDIHMSMMRPLVYPQISQYDAFDREIIFNCLGVYGLLPQLVQHMLPLADLEAIYRAQFVDMSMPPNGYSELLELNAATTVILFNLRNVPEAFMAHMKGLNVTKLKEYRTRFLTYSMFYFERCLNLSPSLTTLCGTLALMSAFHCSGLPHPIDYMCHVATELAYDMGLNRKEAYQQGSATDNHRKRMCWWLLFLFDNFLALRANRNQLIHACDMTVELPTELNTLDCHCNESTRRYMQFIRDMVAFSKVYQESYQLLLSPVAAEKSSSEVVLGVIHCDKILERWRLSLAPECRPSMEGDGGLEAIFPSSKALSIDDYGENLCNMQLHLAYYQLLTGIHKLVAYRPSWIQAFIEGNTSSPASTSTSMGATPRTLSDPTTLVGPFSQPLSASQSLDLCSRASRMTLHLFRRVGGWLPVYYWSVLHNAMNAFVILFIKCITRPLDPATSDELSILRVFPGSFIQEFAWAEINNFWDNLYNLAVSFVDKARAQQGRQITNSSNSSTPPSQLSYTTSTTDNISGPRMPMSAYPTSTAMRQPHLLNPMPVHHSPSSNSVADPNLSKSLDYLLDANTLESLLQVQAMPMMLDPDMSSLLGGMGVFDV